ncbi:hypothetical protein ACB094_05G065900 [Castanea mollissima]
MIVPLTKTSERRTRNVVPLPMVLVHIWLLEAHVEAPTIGSVILAGIPLKLGTYGFLRFLIPMFPKVTLCSTPFIYIISIDLKKTITYSSIAYMNLVTVGMFSQAAAVKTCVPRVRPINLLTIGEKTYNVATKA